MKKGQTYLVHGHDQVSGVVAVNADITSQKDHLPYFPPK